MRSVTKESVLLDAGPIAEVRCRSLRDDREVIVRDADDLAIIREWLGTVAGNQFEMPVIGTVPIFTHKMIINSKPVFVKREGEWFKAGRVPRVLVEAGPKPVVR
jgi:hypothetical protein